MPAGSSGRDDDENEFCVPLEAVEKIQREPSHYTLSMPFTVRLDQPLPDDRHFVLFVASCPLSAKETRNSSLRHDRVVREAHADAASETV